MMDLLTSAMDAGAALAETFSKPVNTGASSTRYGTVVKNNGTTLDVELCGATLAAVPMLTTCAGAKAGDRCLLTVDGPLVTVTGILANADNTHYVRHKMLWEGSLSKGGSATIPELAKYAVFGAGYGVQGLQYVMFGAGPSLFGGSYLTTSTQADDGSSSYALKATFRYNFTTGALTLTAASHHLLGPYGTTGYMGTVNSIYGIC